jgi:hypothetical protein
MSIRHVRVAILSDLHAYHPVPGSGRSSYLPSAPAAGDPDPFGDLEELVERERLDVDLLFCAGDICDKADFRGFQFAWTRLNDLKKRLNARELIATCGNHDLNSRLNQIEEDPDPKGALQTAVPQFPFEDEQLTNQFWARNFALVRPMDGVRVLVLNTSAYHGGTADELNHGRVSQRTIAAITKQLQSEAAAELNILLCHHHVRPLKGVWGKVPDHEFMQKGGELLSALTATTASPWLVLHGHRHVPNLEHSMDPSCIVIGASSFSAQVQGRLNQFHTLNIEVDEHCAQPLKGIMDTWSWNVTSGWQRRPIVDEEEGFPPQCGFGAEYHPRAMSHKIEAMVGSRPGYLEWSDVIATAPEVRYMTPGHFRQTEDLLKQAGIALHRDREGKVVQVGRPT